LDRTGQPFIVAKVAPGTTAQVRRELQIALDNITAEHTGVYEATGNAELKFFTEAAGLTGENFEKAMSHYVRRLSKRILGTSDAADPGANGSNAAVSTRTASTMDPRTVADARAFWTTIRNDLFEPIVRYNRGKFTGEPVLPVARFDFEVSDTGNVATEAFTGIQITSALETIVGKVNSRQLLRSQGIASFRAFFPTIDAALIEGMIGTAGTEDPAQLLKADGSPLVAPAPATPATPVLRSA
jgi:phage gp29-like protein